MLFLYLFIFHNTFVLAFIDSKEVKVLIDLAMISAGEVQMEVDRVSCFNSAVMGFSPLIFNLYPDNGLDDLLEACQEVWENVRADPMILTKWVRKIVVMSDTDPHLVLLSAVPPRTLRGRFYEDSDPTIWI